jgi:RNA polymerase sigma factor (sigma-70 family)
MSDTDLQLLARYTRNHAEDAFSELVRRHLDLVHSAALRQVRSPQLAEEISQSVFTDLARNATKLKPDTILTAWLYQVTRRTAIDVVRHEARRQLREQIVTEMNAMNATTVDWTHIEPLLDDAMSALDETDRAAVLLRYFENKSLREVGATLGTSDDAAQKRVSRAVEHLREFFAKRGVTIGATGLVIVISANAVQAAPIGLAVTISAAASIIGTTIATTATATAIKTIAMTTLQKTIIGATLAVAVGAGVYEAHQASTLRTQLENLQQQQSPFARQLQQLNADYIDATNRLASLADELTKTKNNNMELLKLRGQVGVLRRDATQVDDPSVRTALAWLAKKNKLQKAFEERPDQRIPEMQFLTDSKWLDLVKDLNLDSEAEIQFAMHVVRTSAKMNSARMIQGALKKFIEANNGNWPDDAAQLKPFFDPPIDDEILQRYKILDKDQTQSGWLKGMVLIEKVVVDKWSERQFAIGPAATGLGPTPEPVHLAFPQELKPAMESYQAQNPRKVPSDFNELRPYLTTPEQQAALDKLIKTLQDNK